jgi:hypothetical protein
VPQQLRGSGVVDRPDLQLRQVDVLGRVPRVTRRQHDRERPVGPAGRVLDALTGGRVDPLQVVHHGEHRAVPGRRPQHPEGGDADREPVTGGRRPQGQRAHERRRLRFR